MRYLLVFELTSISYFSATNQIAFKKIHDHMIIINFVAITQLFYIICIVIMDHSIIFGRPNSMLGPIFYYYDVIKINGHNILYLYYILWLSRNFSLADIGTQLFKDEVNTFWIIIYLDIIILCYIDKAILQISTLSNNQYISLYMHKYKFNFDWLKLTNHISNVITTIK